MIRIRGIIESLFLRQQGPEIGGLAAEARPQRRKSNEDDGSQAVKWPSRSRLQVPFRAPRNVGFISQHGRWIANRPFSLSLRFSLFLTLLRVEINVGGSGKRVHKNT